MKQYLFSFSIVLLCLCSFQFTYSQVRPSVMRTGSTQEIAAYDSLSNIRKGNLPSLVGQDIYFVPNDKYERQGSYGIAVLKRLPLNIEDRLFFSEDAYYMPIKSHFRSFNTSYNGLADKSFKIIGYQDANPASGLSSPILELQSLDDSVLYLEYTPSIERGIAVISGFYEKLRQSHVGKLYVPQKYSSLKRLSDDVLINMEPSDTLKCIDVFFKADVRGSAMLLMQSNKNTIKYYIPEEHWKVELWNVDERTQRLLAEQESFKQRETNMIRKYGKTNGKIIAEKKVCIGFTKQMCIDAWGEPKDINRTTTQYGVHEQWVYSGGYLYFDGDKLTSIQN